MAELSLSVATPIPNLTESAQTTWVKWLSCPVGQVFVSQISKYQLKIEGKMLIFNYFINDKWLSWAYALVAPSVWAVASKRLFPEWLAV